MCGRTCLTVKQDAVPYVCSKALPDNKVPDWVGSDKEKQKYSPSANMAPTKYTPVLVMGKQVREKE